MQKMKEAIKKLRESLVGEDGVCRFPLFMHHRRREEEGWDLIRFFISVKAKVGKAEIGYQSGS